MSTPRPTDFATARDAAAVYLDRGWVPLHYDRGLKGPVAKGWEKTTRDDVHLGTFNGGNVGILLGVPSGGLMDVDLDCPEAAQLAPDFLPPTGMKHGRKSNPSSHHWYIVGPDAPRTMQLRDDMELMVVELRGTGGQTMTPPSLNPEDGGELAVWETAVLEPAAADASDLRRATKRLAAAALVLRHWPGKGGRNACALALAGMLARGGLALDDAEHFVGAVARAGGASDHRADVRATYAKIEKGGEATGFPAYAKIAGEKVAAKVAEWLELKRARKAAGGGRATLVDLVDAITADTANVLEGRPLTWNEMNGNTEHGCLPINDAWVTGLRYKLEKEAALKGTNDETCRAVELVAHRRAYHPVRAYLEALTWDRRTRMDDLRRTIRAADTPLILEMLTCWLVSAVARAMEPGCKVDTMLVLVGDQYLGKSKTFRALGGDWFGDTPIIVGTKDGYTNLRQAWIHEWSELDALRRARDIEAVKAFLSSSVDIYRPSYGRFDIRVPRSSVFGGTTNHTEFLADETGNRRFWPITVTEKIDVAAVTVMRDQLWAEAVELYRAGRQWYLSDAREMELKETHAMHKIHDAWYTRVADYLASPIHEVVTVAEVLEHAIQKLPGQWTAGDAKRTGVLIQECGYERGPKVHRGPRNWIRKSAAREPDSRAADVPRGAPDVPRGAPPTDDTTEARHVNDLRGTCAAREFSHVPPDGARHVRHVIDPGRGLGATFEGGRGGSDAVGPTDAQLRAARAALPELNTDDAWMPSPPDGARRKGEPSIVQQVEARKHGWNWDEKTRRWTKPANGGGNR